MRYPLRNLSAFVLAALLGAVVAVPARADIATYAADMSGSNEVPAVDTVASGSVALVVDTVTRQGFWVLEFVDLSSAQTGAHFHSAPAGTNGGVVFALPLGSPANGIWAMSQGDYDALVAGNIYANVHSQNHPGGEIRGQLTLVGIVPNEAVSFSAWKALYR